MSRLIEPSSPDSPKVDLDKVRSIYLLAIAGTGMGSFAQLLKQAGYRVSGSDQKVWPPMSDLLKKANISYFQGFSEENLKAVPDLVIVGNVIRRNNPEAEHIRALRIPHLSFPEALANLFLDKQKSIVVAGTHGKTTTTAMLSWVLHSSGRDPSFLVGGMAMGWGEGASKGAADLAGVAGISARLGEGECFVIEGDEYDTAYFDKGPKLLHYRPKCAILTSVEFDHADIFTDVEHYESAFVRFLPLVPQDGFISVCATDFRAVELARENTRAHIQTYSAAREVQADWTAEEVGLEEGISRFDVKFKGEFLFRASLPMLGAHNIENALGVSALAKHLGLTNEEISKGLSGFQGVARRQQKAGEGRGVCVIDDFAHHPSAVKETVKAIRARYPSRRLWAIFEPRSNTARRSLHQHLYAKSFDPADRVIIAGLPPHPDPIPEELKLNPHCLVEEISTRGPLAITLPDGDAILEHLKAQVEAEDIVLIMSNGSFAGLTRRLVGFLTS